MQALTRQRAANYGKTRNLSATTKPCERALRQGTYSADSTANHLRLRSFNVVTNIRGRKPKIEFSMASASTDNTQFTLGSTREPSFRFSCLCIRRVDTRKRSPASFPLLDTLRCSTYPTSPRTNRAGVHTSRLSQKPFPFLPTSDQVRMIRVQMLVPRAKYFCTETNALRLLVAV